MHTCIPPRVRQYHNSQLHVRLPSGDTIVNTLFNVRTLFNGVLCSFGVRPNGFRSPSTTVVTPSRRVVALLGCGPLSVRASLNSRRLLLVDFNAPVAVLQGFIMCDEVDYTMRRYFGLLYGHMGRYVTLKHQSIICVYVLRRISELFVAILCSMLMSLSCFATPWHV